MAASRDDREWEAEAKRFMSEYQNLVPTRVLNEVLIIERLPLSVRIHYHHATAIPQQVVITAYQHSVSASPEQAEDEYRTTLSAADISCVEDSKGLIGFEGMVGLLRIDIHPTRAAHIGEHDSSAPSPVFPHPIVVREFYKTLIGTSSGPGFARHLLVRRRGKTPDPKNLILACVAFYLRHYGAAPLTVNEEVRASGQSQYAVKPASTGARCGHDFSRVRVLSDAQGNTQPGVERQSGRVGPPAESAARPRLTIKRFAVGSPTRHDLAPPGLDSAATPDKSTGEYAEAQDQSSSVTTFAKKADGVHIEVEATGVYSSAEYPDSFKWTQTIDTNVPLGGTTSPYVDPRPNDDAKPFYWTDAEQATHSTTFIDYPKRPAPGAGTTTWDAILCVNEATKTVTAFDSLTYGFSRDTTGAVTTRAPKSTGSTNHQSILAAEFPGWTFRRHGLSRGAKTAIGVGGGALAGAGIGAVVGGPVGAAVGAGVGALVGGIGSLFF